jgi:hypothetical protein
MDIWIGLFAKQIFWWMIMWNDSTETMYFLLGIYCKIGRKTLVKKWNYY